MTGKLDHCDSCGIKFRDGDSYLPMTPTINVHANIDCAWHNFHHEKVTGTIRNITALKWNCNRPPPKLVQKKPSLIKRFLVYIIERIS